MKAIYTGTRQHGQKTAIRKIEKMIEKLPADATMSIGGAGDMVRIVSESLSFECSLYAGTWEVSHD